MVEVTIDFPRSMNPSEFDPTFILSTLLIRKNKSALQSGKGQNFVIKLFKMDSCTGGTIKLLGDPEKTKAILTVDASMHRHRNNWCKNLARIFLLFYIKCDVFPRNARGDVQIEGEVRKNKEQEVTAKSKLICVFVLV